MKIIIIGGVAGGATAATRLRRLSEENEIIIFEKGPYVSFANCGLPYHIGGTIEKREALLLQTPEKLQERYHLDTRVLTEVIKIDADRKIVTVKNVISGEMYDETYDKLLLSPGAEPIKPNFEGINSEKIFTLRNIPDMDKIITATKAKENFVIVGGGFIGLEIAENLVHLGKSVQLVELGSQVMAPIDPEFAGFVHEEAKKQGLKLLLNTGVEKFEDQGENIKIYLNNGETIEADAVILAIGVRPENQLAKEIGLELGATGGIVVNEFLQTSNESIYAVGDAIEIPHFVHGQKVLIPLAWPANRQGRIVADNIILNNKTAYKGSLGSSILKFFEYSIASTGLNEKFLKRNNINYQSVIITKGNHAGYYPGASNIILKVLFDSEGEIFGAQAIGKDGVDKRIDVIATAMRGKLKVQELQEIEITYAPPFNSAKDLVNIAGYTAENLLNGDLKMINVQDISSYISTEDATLIDVRTSLEFEKGHIDGAININVDDLRANLSTLDQSKKYVVYCQVGLRGYLAYKILSHHGFDVVNVNGGYHIWRASQF